MIKEIAKQLENSQYRNIGSKELFEKAKENNIVILYGASDDILEIEGAFRDEVDSDGGRDFNILTEDDNAEDYSFLKDLNIKIYWHGMINDKQEIETDIPWTFAFNDKFKDKIEEFTIIEDDETNCIGLIIQL